MADATEAELAMTVHRRILIVEDRYVIADDLTRALEQAGVVVIGPAPTIAAALRLLEATPILDGAILDIDLRGKPSFPVADALRNRNIPFVFFTGHEVSILDLTPESGGARSERHAAFGMMIAFMPALASIGVR
jgi:CheY-like chemotaxis protein